MEPQDKKQLLIIEPDKRVRQLLIFTFKKSFSCDLHTADRIIYAERILKDKHIDLIVSELVVNNQSVIPLIRSLINNNNNSTLKIIILSKHFHIKNKINAFEAGASDFLSKPFHPIELVARVKKELDLYIQGRYITSSTSKISLDEHKKEMIVNRIKVKLTITEFLIMYHMMQNRSYCDHSSLIRYLSIHKGRDLKENALRVSITRLRDKIQRSTGMRVIKSRHGQGYYLGI